MIHVLDTGGWQHVLHGVDGLLRLLALGTIGLGLWSRSLLGLAVANCFPLLRHVSNESLEDHNDVSDDGVTVDNVETGRDH